MKLALRSASRRIVATAMLEVAPNTSTREGNTLANVAYPPAGYPAPEIRIECRIDKSGKPLPLRIETLEMRGAHARVLCRIHAPAKLSRDVGQPVQQVEGNVGPDGKIESQHDTGHGKRHH